MKNFSDLLATDRQAIVACKLMPIIDNGSPHCVVTVNNEIFLDQELSKPTEIMAQIDITKKMSLSIAVSGKVYCQDRETAIVVESLTVDGIPVVPGLEHLTHYENDHSQMIKTSYLGYNGLWSFSTDTAFYQWHHRVTGQGWLLTPIA